MSRGMVCRVDKVYGDVVDASGRYAILYIVNVRLGPLTLIAEQLVSNRFAAPGMRLRVRRSVCLPLTEPTGRICVGPSEWMPDCPAVEQTFTDSGHEYRWRCLCPGGAGVIRHGDASLAGQGYLEHLSFALPPWELALGELRWGRWLGENDSVVWVASDEAGFSLIVRRGEAVAQENIVAIAERRIETSDFSLDLAAVETIRKGALIGLLSWPLGWLLPRSLTAIDEDKRLFEGSLRERDGTHAAPTRGFAIAESVIFPHSGHGMAVR